MPEQTVQLIHPDLTKKMPRDTQHEYELVKEAILTLLPWEGQDLPFKELGARVSTTLSPADRESLGSISWYTTSVKLDLEARGLIERIPGVNPQHLRRVA